MGGSLRSQVRREFATLKTIEWSFVFVGFLGYIFVATTYKLPIGDVAIGLALLGLLIQRHRFRFTSLQVWFGLFILWATIGYFTTAYPSVVSQQLIDLVKVWLIVLVACNALRSPQQIRFFTVFFLAWYVFYPARGAILNNMSGDPFYARAAWNYMFANSNDLAALSILQLSMAAGLVGTEPKGLVRLGAIVGVVVLPIVVLLTQSRGAFIALVFFGALTLRGRINLKTIMPLVLVAAIAITFAPSSMWTRVIGLARFSTAPTADLRDVDPEGSAESRWNILIIASQIVRDHPGIGVGVGAYQDAHWAYSPRNSNLPWLARGPKDTHNTYMNLAAETGFVGLAIFLGLIFATLRRTWQARRRARRLAPAFSRQLIFLEAGLLAYLIAGIFGSFGKLSFLYIHLALMLALSSMIMRNVPSSNRHPTTSLRASGLSP
jgi:O-antigen ligase